MIKRTLSSVKRRIQSRNGQPHDASRSLINEFTRTSYAQTGEDIILDWYFFDHPTGFYVDIGAHHPVRYSNTYLFYQKGWRGINVDALPGSMEPFQQLRPEDVNLEVGVSECRQVLKYHSFDDPAVNGFSPELSESRDGHHYKLLSVIDIQTYPLSELLEKHLPSGQKIDFMNVDVEGLDLEVLRSNDWTRFRPKLILVEDFDFVVLNGTSKSPIHTFLTEQGYVPCSKTAHTIIFALPEYSNPSVRHWGNSESH